MQPVQQQPQPPHKNRFIKTIRWLLPNGGTILIVLMLLMTQSAWGAAALATTQAASTNTIKYQGRIADSDGNSITDAVAMTFRLYRVPTGGTPLWEEYWQGANIVNISDGLFSVALGSLEPTLTDVIQGESELYLGIEIDGDSEMSPRVQLGTVPFAVQSLTVPDGSITVEKLDPDMDIGMPDGTIVMWSGAVTDIPDGWVLCDGTNGTPNLQDRFILSINAGENPGATGGEHEKMLSAVNLPSHTHAFTTNYAGNHSHGTRVENEDDFDRGNSQGGVDNFGGNGRGLESTTDGNHRHSGTTNATGSGAAFDIRPQFFKLAFIMKANN